MSIKEKNLVQNLSLKEMVKKRRNTTVYLKLQTGTVTLPHGFVTPEFTTPSRDLIIYSLFNINIDRYPYTNVMVRHVL